MGKGLPIDIAITEFVLSRMRKYSGKGGARSISYQPA